MLRTLRNPKGQSSEAQILSGGLSGRGFLVGICQEAGAGTSPVGPGACGAGQETCRVRVGEGPRTQQPRPRRQCPDRLRHPSAQIAWLLP